jgi:NADH-quinone oxidoreductase subunit M
VVAPILALIVFLGVYPKPVLERMQPSVDRLIEHVDENRDFTSPSTGSQEAGR